MITANAYSGESSFRGMKRSKNDKNLEEFVRSAYISYIKYLIDYLLPTVLINICRMLSF